MINDSCSFSLYTSDELKESSNSCRWCFTGKLFFIKAAVNEIHRHRREDVCGGDGSLHFLLFFLLFFLFFSWSDNCSLSLLIMVGWRWEESRKPSNAALMLMFGLRRAERTAQHRPHKIVLAHTQASECLCECACSAIFARTVRL